MQKQWRHEHPPRIRWRWRRAPQRRDTQTRHLDAVCVQFLECETQENGVAEGANEEAGNDERSGASAVAIEVPYADHEDG